MPRSTFILLPPSEAKNRGGVAVAPSGYFDRELASARREIVEALGDLLSTAESVTLERTLHVRGPLLERALGSWRQIVEGTAPLMPAFQRYSGVVWSHLDPTQLSAPQRRRILVPSGLYGLSRADDLIADYRLKMNVGLARVGNVANFWKKPLTQLLLSRLSGSCIVNLLPLEHNVGFDWGELNASVDVMTVSFVDADGERAAGHAAKAVKGIVAREVLVGGVASLESFSWSGWTSRTRAGQLEIIAPRK